MSQSVGWYPDTTPDNLEKWKIPSCLQCNHLHARSEGELLVRFGLCLDPDDPKNAGIVEKALRAVSAESARDAGDAAARGGEGDMSEKHYTFKVCCTFEMQYTFTESEVQRDPEGDKYAVEPTDAAIEALEVELQEYLSETYPIEEIDVSTDSDLILHDPRDAPTS